MCIMELLFTKDSYKQNHNPIIKQPHSKDVIKHDVRKTWFQPSYFNLVGYLGATTTLTQGSQESLLAPLPLRRM